MVELTFKRLIPTVVPPSYGTDGAIGLDLRASLIDRHDEPYEFTLRPKERCIIPTGLAFAIPEGFYGRIAPRSGLAAKQGLDVLAGVIDPDYTGEVKIIILNTSENNVTLGNNQRIAQLILERAEIGSLVETVGPLKTTNRGSGRFGSTGTH